MNPEPSAHSSAPALGSLRATDDALAAFGDPATLDQTVCILAMLRFRGGAPTPAQPGVEGEVDNTATPSAATVTMDAFGEFVEMLEVEMAATQARSVFYADVDQVVIGHPEEHWDLVTIVEFPTRQACLDIVNGAAFQAMEQKRLAGLADMRLVVMPS